MKKIITIVLAVIMGLSTVTLSGCGGKEKVDSESAQTLEVYVYNAGYGYKWCEAMLEAFQKEDWVKEKYPNLSVDFTQDAVKESASTHLKSEDTKFDVVFCTDGWTYANKEYAVDLYELVFDKEVPGEDTKYSGKMTASMLNSLRDVHTQDSEAYYSTSWANVMTGIVYNETKLNALGFTVPNTTDELLKICESVYTGVIVEGAPLNGEKTVGDAIDRSVYGNKYSFITYGVSPYTNYSLSTWWAQYEGLEEYYNFFQGNDGIGVSPSVLKQAGRLEALKVLEEIQKKDGDNERYTKLEPSAEREAYRNAQSRVVLGEALFMCNGDWFDYEMNDFSKAAGEKAGVVKLMRTPVISSLKDKTNITSDKQLSQVVSAIDQGYKTKADALMNGNVEIETVSDEDYQTVYEARKMMYSIGASHSAIIPKCSPAQELAADFLRYIATDKCLEIFAKETKGGSLPFVYDLKTNNEELFDSLSAMGKGATQVLSDADLQILPNILTLPLVQKGSFAAWKSIGDKPGYMMYSKGQSAQEIFDNDYSYWTDDNNRNWELAKSNAGI